MESESSVKDDAKIQNSEPEGTQSSEACQGVEKLNGDCESVEKNANDAESSKKELSNDVKENNEKREKAGGQVATKSAKNTRGKKRKASEPNDDENANSKIDKKDPEVDGSKGPQIELEKSDEKSVDDSSIDRDKDESKDKNQDKAKNDDASIPLSSTEALGKGKRARIPNKRYSDIALGGNSRRKSIEHTPINDLEIKQELLEEELPSFSQESQESIYSTPIHSPTVGKGSHFKMDDKYLEPFKHGWKRELVYRTTTSGKGKRQGDIYYYSPTGKKLRSMREILGVLKKSDPVTVENFTFHKEPLGADEGVEIIRDAKYKVSDTTTPLKKYTIPEKKILTPKLSADKILTPKPRLSAKGATTPKEKMKIKVPMKLKEKKMGKPEDSPDTNILPTSTPTKKPEKRTNSERSLPCSMTCARALGVVPTLQCRLCLCLYHHECVGLEPHLTLPYVCKNCHLVQGQNPNHSTTIVAPPPLTPINTLKSINTHSTVLPKLQRIPKNDTPQPAPSKLLPLPEPPKLTPRPPQKETENKSLVGSVTTWLPHNSKIVEGSTEVPRPQYLEILGGRRFLVIPKHNFMSVSPNYANKPEESIAVPEVVEPVLDSASLGPKSVENEEQAQEKPMEDEPNVTEKESQSIGKELARRESESVEIEEGPSEKEQEVAEKVEMCAVKNEPKSPQQTESQQTLEPMDVDPAAPSSIDAPPAAVEEQKEKTGEFTPPESPSKPKKRNLKLKSITNSTSEERIEAKFMDNYFQNISFGYNTLLYVFQYLKVQDLLRAGCVCTMWRDIASHPILWRTVRMKNSQVHSFEGLANTLKKHGTMHLDMRKMLLPTSGEEIWPEFSKSIARVDTLRKIELCRCPANVVEQLAITNPDLEVLNAVTIKCESMNLDSLQSFTKIRELRLKSTSGLSVQSIDSLKELKTLKHLSLTSITNLHTHNLSVIAELTNLESLDLGECLDFPKNFGEAILAKLENLEKLRLEKGQGNCHTFDILNAVRNMKKLEQLELVNFDVKAGFDKALGGCQNIKKLMIIPTYISQSATTNHMVLGGVLRLQKTLSHFVWGVTLELLRVTELFVDQCEEPKEKKDKKPTGNGDSIPVLKPVPLLKDRNDTILPPHDPAQVEILSLPSLQKLLLNSLPTTRVKILKIPFHATWRQTLTDSVN